MDDKYGVKAEIKRLSIEQDILNTSTASPTTNYLVVPPRWIFDGKINHGEYNLKNDKSFIDKVRNFITSLKRKVSL